MANDNLIMKQIILTLTSVFALSILASAADDRKKRRR